MLDRIVLGTMAWTTHAISSAFLNSVSTLLNSSGLILRFAFLAIAYLLPVCLSIYISFSFLILWCSYFRWSSIVICNLSLCILLYISCLSRLILFDILVFRLCSRSLIFYLSSLNIWLSCCRCSLACFSTSVT